MLLFSCPFCGPRAEAEFLFVAEMGQQRPAPAEQVSDAQWSAYLHGVRNVQGGVHEVWQHTPCGQLFSMVRDSRSMGAEPGQFLPQGPAQ